MDWNLGTIELTQKKKKSNKGAGGGENNKKMRKFFFFVRNVRPRGVFWDRRTHPKKKKKMPMPKYIYITTDGLELEDHRTHQKKTKKNKQIDVVVNPEI